MEAARLEVIIDGDNSGANRALDETNKKVKATASDYTLVGGGLTAVGLGIFKGLAGGIGIAGDFEHQMSAVKSVTGGSAEDVARWRKEILSLGSTTPFSAQEVARSYEEMAKAGVPVNQINKETAQGFLDLAAATDTDLVKATEVGATAMTQFGLTSKQVADVISQSTNASSLDVNDWALALKSVGPVASSLGIPMEDLAATMMILADNGIKGEVAATSLRNIISNLADTSHEGTQALDALGISTYDQNGNFRGLEAVMTDLVPHWKNMNDEQKMMLAQQIAGVDGAPAFLAAMNAQEEAVSRGSSAFEERKKAMAGVGTAEEQAKARMDNFNSALDEFKGALETVAIVVGSVFLPVLRKVVEFLTNMVAGAIEWFVGLSPAAQKVTAALLGLAAALPILVGGFLLLKAAVMSGFAASMFAILAPIALVIGAIAALGAGVYLAYQHFEPFRNAVDSVIDVLQDFGTYLKEVWKSGNVMNDAMDALPKPLREVAKHVGRVVDAFADLKRAFDRGGVKELVRQLPRELAQVGRAFLDLGRIIFDNVRDAFRDAFARFSPSDAFNTLRSKLGNALTSILQFMADGMQNALTAMTNAINSFDWNNVGSLVAQGLMAIVGAIVGLGAVIATALYDAISNVDWGGVGTALVNFLTTVLEAAGAFIQGFGSTIGAAFMSLFRSINWGSVGSAIQSGFQTALSVLASVGSWILSNLGEIASTVSSWFMDQISAVNWGETFQTGIDILTSAGSWIIDKLGDAATAIGGWFMEQVGNVQWQALFDLAISSLASAGAWIVDKLGDAATGIGGWFMEQVGNVQWQSLFDLAISVLSSAGSWIVDKLGDAATAIGSWFMTQLGNVQWQSLFDLAVSVLSSAGSWIVDKLGDVATGIGGWFMEQLGNVQWEALFDASISVLSNVGSWIKDKIGSGVTLLVEFGRDVVQGLLTSITANWTEVSSWLGEIKGKITDKFNGSKEWLKGVGTGIIDGFKQAMSNAWEGIEGWITEKINGFLEIINGVIESFNAVAGKIGIPEIPEIPLIGEQSKETTKQVGNLDKALTQLGKGMDRATLLASVEAAEQGSLAYGDFAIATLNLETGVIRAATAVMKGNKPLTESEKAAKNTEAAYEALTTSIAKTRDVFSGKLPEAIPEGGTPDPNKPIDPADNPMYPSSGSNDFTSNFLGPIRQGALQTTAFLTTETAKWASVVGSNTAKIIPPAVQNFLGVNSAAQSGLAPVPTTIGATLGSAVSTATTSLMGLGVAAATQFSAVPTAASTNLAPVNGIVSTTLGGAALAASASLLGMGLAAATQFGAVPTAATNSLSPVNGIVSSTLGGAALAASASLLGMGLAAAVQFAAVPAAASSNLGTLGGIVGGLVSSAVSAGTSGFNSLRGSAVSNFAQIPISAASNFGSMLASVTSNTASAASSAASNTAKMAASVGSNAATMAANAIKSATLANTSTSAQMLGMQMGATLASATMRSNVSSNANAMQSAVNAAATGAANAMRVGMQAASNAVSSAASSWAGYVRSGGGAAAATAASIGANIGASLAAGIRSMYGAVAAAAAALVAQADIAMRARAQIASPSKMTTYFGEMLGQGLVDGMDDMMRPVGLMGDRLMGEALTQPVSNPFNSATRRNAVPVGGNVTVYQTNYYTVNVEDLEDLNEAVEFVKDLPRERELVFAE